MGLDQYIQVREPNGNLINDELFYWRKCYAIRDLFIRNLDHFEDNGESEITPKCCDRMKSDLQKILNGSSSITAAPPDSWYRDVLGQTPESAQTIREELEDFKEQLNKISEYAGDDDHSVFYYEWY